VDAPIIRRGSSRVPVDERVTILRRAEGRDDLSRRGRANCPVRPFSR